MIASVLNQKQDLYRTIEGLSLHFRIELPFQEVLYYFEAIGGYNSFTPSDQVDMLLRIDELIPRTYYNERNPNNGTRAYTVSVGNEGSMVLYLRFTSFKNIGNESTIIAKVQDITHELETIAYTVGKADEFSMDLTTHGDGETLELRIWWD